jgi:NitT/TauT family transport system permease protein
VLRALSNVVLPTVVFVGILGLWYAGSYVLIDSDRRFLVPPPHQVAQVAFGDVDNLNELLAGLALSAEVAMTGLVLATGIGLTMAIVMSQARWIERSLYPYAVVLQTVPVLALVPLIGYWFGYAFSSRVLVCVLIAIFPIIANALFGLRSVDPGLHDLFTMHAAGRWVRLVKLQIPAALPAIFTGLRISAGAAVIGAVVGDFFFQQGQPGIGQLIYQYNRQLHSEKLFAAVLLACFFGLVVFWIFGFLASRVAKWHESAHDRPTRKVTTI